MSTDDKIKIFLVDDDVMFIESLKHTLTEERAEITAFSNADECLDKLDENPHIVVLDYSLNNTMNGVQVLNRIKQSLPDTEVIMLSGVNNRAIMDDTMKYGAYDYIEKGESALFKLRNEIKHLCDDIESDKELEKENHKVMWINAGIILSIIIIYLLNRLL